ncbi:MAG: hypothetical protein JJE21_06255 [Spirochaetaceae bacterium]|nr:hypothetical protein [Spirochaetaceae bacterium]
MKTKFKKFIFVLFTILCTTTFTSCISLSPDHFISPRWLIGTWGNSTVPTTTRFTISQNEIIRYKEIENVSSTQSVVEEFTQWLSNNKNSYINYNEGSDSYSFVYHDDNLDIITKFEKIDDCTIKYSVNTNGKIQESIELTKVK